MKITKTDLENVVRRLNTITNSPQDSYVKDKSGKYIAQIGNYHLDGAYGGWALHRMQNESGGITDVLRIGHVSKRELYLGIQAYIAGILEVKS